MVRRCLLVGLAGILAGGCFNGLDFDSTATTMNATVAADGAAVVRICSHPGLLTCEAAASFHASLDGEERATTVDLFGARVAAFPAGAADGAVLRVTRDGDGASATVSVPEGFTLDGPAAVRAGNGITISWQPSARPGRMTWSAEIACQSGRLAALLGDAVADTGTLAIAASRLPAPDNSDCTATVTLRRERDGSVDDAFEDGSRLVAAQERTISFERLP
jgi:hypothetical protein